MLAIGIVVDDAIVVVENVERWLERGLAPREAAHQAMDEVTGPIIAMALVLCAVFVPCAFIGGITGHFFRQFAVTITASTRLLGHQLADAEPGAGGDPSEAAAPECARTSRPGESRPSCFGHWHGSAGSSTASSMPARGSMSPFVARFLRVSLIVLIVYGGLVALTYWVFSIAPTGFVPDQDQGRLIVSIQLPDSSSLERTREITKQVDAIALQDPGGPALGDRGRHVARHGLEQPELRHGVLDPEAVR